MVYKWQEACWGDIATLEYGKGLRSYNNGVGAYPVYGTNGPIGWHPEPLCNYPSVIIGRKGAYRGVHYSKKPFYVIDTAFYLNPKVNLDLRWAYYELLTHDINSMDSGSAIPSTSRDEFYKLPVKIPALTEQLAIAHILGTLDDKIELNQQMNQTLEAIARAIFKSWFVDFDPVRAKMEGKQPPGMDAATADLFPDKLEDSQLGKIPKGWRVLNVGEVCEFAYGKSLKENSRRSGSVPVYGSNGQIGWHDEALVKGPGVIIGRKGNPGVVTWASTDFFSIDTTFYVIPKGEICCMHYFFHALSLLNLASLGADSAVPGLNRHMAYMTKLLVPPTEVLNIFASHVSVFANKVSSNKEQSRTLATIRDTLLPKLLSGEIRVRDAEQVIEVVA